MDAKHLSYEKFEKVFRYEPETGQLYWLERIPRPGKQLGHIDRSWNDRFANKPVARRVHKHGHLYVGHLAKNYAAHRIIWLLHYKEQPPNGIDHINGDPSDNRISNLRAANQSQNAANSAIRSDNTSGVKGVSWDKKSNSWYVYINKNQKMYGLGHTKCLEEAKKIRKEAEEKLFGEFARAA